jgi:protein-S-isoprenylcysteine O-methyltransferase Ste14
MRRSNVPVPEAHLAALGAGLGLDWVIPLRLPLGRRGWILAAPLIAGGVALAAWAVASAGDVDVDRDADLVTDGAYALTRNPMYVGWSCAVLGLAIARRSVWLVAGWGIAVRRLHREIRAEEHRLGDRFGDRAAAYRSRVPRYVGLPTGLRISRQSVVVPSGMVTMVGRSSTKPNRA